MRVLPFLIAFGLTMAAAVGVTGCTTTVDLDPAEAANDPLCAEVTSNLPGTVSGQARRWTDAQATGAWGDPAKVLLTCGVAPPGPTTLPCQDVAGVDWIIDDSDAPRFRVTTFGRTPAVEIYLDTTADENGDGVSSRDVLDALSPIVSVLPVDGRCLDRSEATPAP
ncbi:MULTISPECIES: DUF3515 family protein [Microbacterium]|uniref:DUF3515 family protein n=1 Tax=Microbacterium trichothecenolyticum TaxID=69370 RepID=A0A0M2HAA8_MICTR|nr:MULTISPECIES: DUF3515 family protein [Microbacterium]KJL43413.1 hypothetical protein RS82_01465 [Microbacterium trichothecenolyticum]MDR7189659.1 hypothetical protein [Microbacterium sp. BE35]